MPSTRETESLLRRFRCPVSALCIALLVLGLSGCGGGASNNADDTGTKASAGAGTSELAEVSFTGAVGEKLTATWHSKVDTPKSTTVTTLVKGDGETIADGETVSTYLWIGNGTTKKDVYSDYDNGSPESIPNNDQLGEVFTKIISGSTYGSRVVAVTTARELFGSSVEDNGLGVEATDTLVIVADLVEKAAVSPTPTDDAVHDASPNEQPKIIEENGEPTGLDFSGIDEPGLDTPVQRVTLKQGAGAAVQASDTVVVDYLGATYDAKKPFDESYSRTPLTTSLSDLIQGWSIGLTGVKIGSRVLIQIPPAYGYGAQDSGSIKGNATLWFVIDVLKVK